MKIRLKDEIKHLGLKEGTVIEAFLSHDESKAILRHGNSGFLTIPASRFEKLLRYNEKVIDCVWSMPKKPTERK